MSINKLPTTADIYLEVNGVKVAVVQSYKVTAVSSSWGHFPSITLLAWPEPIFPIPIIPSFIFLSIFLCTSLKS